VKPSYAPTIDENASNVLADDSIELSGFSIPYSIIAFWLLLLCCCACTVMSFSLWWGKKTRARISRIENQIAANEILRLSSMGQDFKKDRYNAGAEYGRCDFSESEGAIFAHTAYGEISKEKTTV